MPITIFKGNNEPTNVRQKLPFTRVATVALLLLSRDPCVVELGGRRRGKKKSKGRKEFNIKKLSFCVDMKIPRISAFFRRLFPSPLPPSGFLYSRNPLLIPPCIFLPRSRRRHLYWVSRLFSERVPCARETLSERGCFQGATVRALNTLTRDLTDKFIISK